MQKTIPKTRDELGMRLLEHAAACELPVETDVAQRVSGCGMSTLLSEIELPLLSLLAQMESVGLQIDVNRFKQLASENGVGAGAVRRLRRAVDWTACRVYTHFNSLGTKFGQVTMRRFAFGGMPGDLKSVFLADEGRTFIKVRYTENDWRIAAWLSGDPYLMEVFTNPRRDFFGEMTRFRLGNETIPTSNTLRKETIREMQKFLFHTSGIRSDGIWSLLWETLDKNATGLLTWMKMLERQTCESQYVQTAFGRIVAVRQRDLNSDLCFLISVYTLVRATAADIFKIALLRIERMKHPEARLLLIDRESVLLDVPHCLVDEVRCQLPEIMERPIDAAPLRFPVEIGWGKRWADCLNAEETEDGHE